MRFIGTGTQSNRTHKPQLIISRTMSITPSPQTPHANTDEAPATVGPSTSPQLRTTSPDGVKGDELGSSVELTSQSTSTSTVSDRIEDWAKRIEDLERHPLPSILPEGSSSPATESSQPTSTEKTSLQPRQTDRSVEEVHPDQSELMKKLEEFQRLTEEFHTVQEGHLNTPFKPPSYYASNEDVMKVATDKYNELIKVVNAMEARMGSRARSFTLTEDVDYAVRLRDIGAKDVGSKSSSSIVVFNYNLKVVSPHSIFTCSPYHIPSYPPLSFSCPSLNS